MSIICGTDFSEHSSQALHAAAHLAQRMGLPLHLVHVMEFSGEGIYQEPKAAISGWAERQLDSRAETLRALGGQVFVHLETGHPDSVLLRLATLHAAKLIVVAALGRRPLGEAPLGSHAERLAQSAHIPVLVVRNDEPFRAWVRQERPLRIVLGADLSPTSQTAMRWIEQLRSFGPCEVVALNLYWPPEEFRRLGLTGARSYIDPDPTVTKTLERDLSARLALEGAPGPTKLRLEPHLGRVGDRLAALATQENADLLVVGSHARGVARVWQGSVSRDALTHANVSVACIPSETSTASEVAPPLRSVLVATDFSRTGNSAVPLAYAAVDSGGTVHLLHVTKDPGHRPTDAHDIFSPNASPKLAAAHDEAEQHLLALVPNNAFNEGKATRLHVVESNHAAEAICQAAERLGVDLICVGTHGRTGLAKTVLGSVAQAMLALTHRPVLLARKPPE